MKTILKGLDNGLTITQSLRGLKRNCGFYSFNRFMANHGFSIKYTLSFYGIEEQK